MGNHRGSPYRFDSGYLRDISVPKDSYLTARMGLGGSRPVALDGPQD